MYDGLLKCAQPTEARLVAFADDVAVVIIAKYLEEVNWAFDKTYNVIRQWMIQVGLTLAEHKTEAVLITSRQQTETLTLQMGDYTITSQPYIRYLGIMIDARLNFRKHVEGAGAKASGVVSVLSRLMPNVGGPKQKRRLLLASVTTSVLMYGAAIWSQALSTQETHRKIASVYRLSALRVASAFRTVSYDAVCVTAGMLPLDILAEERESLYRMKGEESITTSELRNKLREESLNRWQQKWDTSNKGRWTYRLIPKLEIWINRRHGDINYYLTQMITGHGCYRYYLHRFNHDDSPECPTCIGQQEDAEHVFFACPRYDIARAKWEMVLKGRAYPEDLISKMLLSEEAWEATTSYATEVLKDLRSQEKARRSAIPITAS